MPATSTWSASWPTGPSGGSPQGVLRRRPLGETGAGAGGDLDQPWSSGMAMSATWAPERNEPMRLAVPVSRLTL
jgi:hypothetical protein